MTELGRESSGLPPGELLPAVHCGADRRLGMATVLWNNQGPAALLGSASTATL